METIFQNICRICITAEGNPSKIEATFINFDGNLIPILEVLNLFSDVKINENYPDSICCSCIEKATNVYKFKVQCDKSSKYLRERNEQTNPLKWLGSVEIPTATLGSKADLKDFPNENATKTEKKPIKVGRKTRKSKKNGSEDSTEEDLILFCHLCNKYFKNKYILSAHEKRHQYKGQFLCNVCGKGFNSQSCLTRHARVHTGEKKYKCEVCQRKFPSSNNLKLHSRTHSGIKPYLCTICGKSFSHPTGLTYHMRTHTKERPYKCDVCSKAFLIQCHLDRHRKTHSGERPFPCQQCEKAFIKKIDLQRHEAVHAGVKPYVCNICNKAFLRKMHLNYHVMVHTRERPHVCPKCGKGFIRRYYLKDHMNRRHEAANVQETKQ